MTEEQLSHFSPKFGDQVAVKAFCHLHRSETSRITEVQRPVDSSRILQRLRERVKSKVMADPKRGFGNTNAKKSIAQIFRPTFQMLTLYCVQDLCHS